MVSLPSEWASPMAQRARNPPATQETQVQSLGWEDSPGEGNGNPLRYSCLEYSMDRGAWWARVLGVRKSQTQLRLTSTFHFTFRSWKALSITGEENSLSLTSYHIHLFQHISCIPVASFKA